MTTITAQQWSQLSASLVNTLGDAQADTLMSLLPLPNEGGYATKADVASLGGEIAQLRAEMSSNRSELKIEMAELRTELKTEIMGNRSELKTEIMGNRSELKTEIAALRSEMAIGFAAVDSRFAEVDSRFAQVDSRFAQVDSRFAQVDSRFAEQRIQIRNDTRTLIATQSVFLLTAAGVALGVARLLI